MCMGCLSMSVATGWVTVKKEKDWRESKSKWSRENCVTTMDNFLEMFPPLGFFFYKIDLISYKMPESVHWVIFELGF